MPRLKNFPPDSLNAQQDQARQLFDQKELDALTESIKENGQLEPGGVHVDADGKYQLIYGWRRLCSCKKLNIPFRAYLFSGLSQLEINILQYHENHLRQKLHWTDKIKELTKLAQDMSATWGISDREIAARLGVSPGTLSEAQKIYTYAQNAPKIWALKTASEARAAIKTQIEAANTQLMNEFFEEEESDKTSKKPKPSKSSKIEKVEEPVPAKVQGQLIHNSFEDVEKFYHDPFQLVFFDPPWGEDITLKKRNQDERVKPFDDSPKQWEKCTSWLQLIKAQMAPVSYIFFFLPGKRITDGMDMLSALGFKVRQVPCIWKKNGVGYSRNPYTWPRNCHESFIIGKLGIRKLTAPVDDIFEAPVVPQKWRGRHPTPKHPKLYHDIIKAFGRDGDSILDPMAGTGTTAVAAQKVISTGWTHCRWTCVERDAEFVEQIKRNLDMGYDLCKGKSTPVVPEDEDKELIADFKYFTPGSFEWKEFWQEHPEKQEEMLAWKKTQD